MKRTNLASELTVSGHLKTADFDELAKAGVHRIVNTRSDGEKLGRLTAAETARLAADRGIDYRHNPVTMQAVSADAVHAFGTPFRKEVSSMRIVARACGWPRPGVSTR